MEENLMKNSPSEICKDCGNSGWITYERDGMIYSRICPCGIRQRQIEDSRLRFAAIPEAFKSIRLREIRPSIYRDESARKEFMDACRLIKNYLDGYANYKTQGKGLYLWSRTKGSGKTHMIAAITNELMSRYSIQAKFCTSAQIVNEIRSTWDNREGQTESQLLSQLQSVEVLVIDDFGSESIKDWVNERMYNIINGRYVDSKVTMFTSNASLQDLKYDDRIINRLLEKSYQIHFPEYSLRLDMGKDNEGELRDSTKL